MDTLIVPPEFKQRYIERRKGDIEKLRQALMAGDLEPFQRIGHQLQGNALSFGFEDLQQIGVEMENAAKAADVAGAGEQLTAFAEWFERTIAV